MSLLPRFPQPFLELLYFYCTWAEILALVSVDKRERSSRAFWLNNYSAVDFENATLEEEVAFHQIYRGCIVRQRIFEGEDVLFTNVQELELLEYKDISECDSVKKLTCNLPFEYDDEFVIPSTVTTLSINLASHECLRSFASSFTLNITCLQIVGNRIFIDVQGVVWPPQLTRLYLDTIADASDLEISGTLTHLVLFAHEISNGNLSRWNSLTHFALRIHNTDAVLTFPPQVERLYLDAENAITWLKSPTHVFLNDNEPREGIDSSILVYYGHSFEGRHSVFDIFCEPDTVRIYPPLPIIY